MSVDTTTEVQAEEEGLPIVLCKMTKRELRICILALDTLAQRAPRRSNFVSKLTARFVLLHKELDQAA